MEDYVLQMRGICKSFNKITVLNGIDLFVCKGEIHALLGENGAGKSTLMNILGGVHQPDQGEISIQGEKTSITSPRASKAKGISFIHQELNVVADLKVYENVFLGAELVNRFGILDVAEMCKKTSEILAKMGVEIDPRQYVRDLEASYRQVVEIARALLEDAKIIIMDEPTTSLTDHEIVKLMRIMRSLKESGVSLIYISHKLKEVFQICDRYTVLRDGVLAGSGKLAEVNEEDITKLMVGRSVSGIEYYRIREKGSEILNVKNLSCEKLFKNISFTVGRGQILGFTGLTGDGRSELFESIFGFRNKARGSITVNGVPLAMLNTSRALRAGIGYVPKNRKENGIIKDMSVLQNMSLAALDRYVRKGLIRRKQERNMFYEYKDKLNIKVSDPDIPITSLSGGNQQKVILAKWLEANTDILIFDHPTQGIDVGAKSEIYQLIMHLSELGKAIIILSSEVPELQKLCDEVKVMYQGEITATLNRDQIDEETVMLYATGAKREGIA